MTLGGSASTVLLAVGVSSGLPPRSSSNVTVALLETTTPVLRPAAQRSF